MLGFDGNADLFAGKDLNAGCIGFNVHTNTTIGKHSDARAIGTRV